LGRRTEDTPEGLNLTKNKYKRGVIQKQCNKTCYCQPKSRTEMMNMNNPLNQVMVKNLLEVFGEQASAGRKIQRQNLGN